MVGAHARMCLLVVVTSATACGSKDSNDGTATGSGKPATPTAATCPATTPASAILPNVKPEHRTLAYWLQRTPGLDEVVVDVDGIRDMNASLAVDRGGDWRGEHNLTGDLDRERLARDVTGRLKGLHDKLVAGELVERDGAAVRAPDIAVLDPANVTAALVTVAPELRVALEAVPLRCGPRTSGFFAKATAGAAINTRFDRNSCSTVHPQEVVQILAKWPNGMHLARTRYATGWIAADAPLSPPIPEPLRTAYVHGPRVQADEDLARKASVGKAQCPAGTLLQLIEGQTPRVRFASATGFHEAEVGEARVQPTRRPVTRRALLTEAFRFLDAPYGWGGGGSADGHDCSGFIMDLFAAFDVRLPRHSGWQARAGTFSIDVSKVTDAQERLRLVDAATRKGVVLLSFPGHIMLYLGRSDAGAPMVLHALAEYAAACAGGGETLYQLDRISVSDLELGRGSSRHSLLERLTTVTVIGKPPGVELAGAAELRPAAPLARPNAKACRDSQDVAIFSSPLRPNSKQPLRVILTANRDPGTAELVLFDPAGNRVVPTNLVRLAGGPPWSVVATVDAPAHGAWTAALGDGSRIDACRRIGVATKPPVVKEDDGGEPTTPAWDIDREWGRATENLYATFVQRLFDFPPDQDLTWPDLNALVRDPARNILFDHLQRGEDATLKLKPDCADLPFLLRAYFAWKLELPFAYHTCTRGTAKQRPVCEPEFATNLVIRDLLDDKLPDKKAELPAELTLEIEETDGIEETQVGDVDAFAMFWARHASRAVHAATGRTVPDDELTDYYPVSLSRESLRPGTVYNDPFGHVMVIAAWVPQTATSYGVMLAADAQPDGTVGRKRFWRGNFLFSTETKVSGSGFKAFRPVLFDKDTRTVSLMENKDLRRSRVFPQYSLQQYEGTIDTFHDTMEALVNPRPLDPFAALGVVVDSLHSQAKLRVVSVKNGEDWFAANAGPMVMPDGDDIFLTTGPWEDFATPSRDFRLLIAIDTVLGFAASVKRSPARFALQPGAALDATLKRLDTELDAALRAKTIEYVRSDGRKQSITLRDVVDRRTGFEMSYNPNDCVEVRWGAPEGSGELGTCRRRAPQEQLTKMAEYRAWFRDRKRPAR